jgi:hypothetical protein
MSGMEPILIGAALGAGVGGATAGIRGGDPLKGALMGGLTGAAGGGISSGLSAVGSTAQAGAGSAGASLLESGTAGMMGDVLEQAALSGIPYSQTPFFAGAQHLMREPGTTMGALGSMMPGSGMNMAQMAPLASMAGQMMGGQQSQNTQISAPPMRQGQMPQMSSMDDLMRMQMMAQRQRRPISLL